MISTQDLTQKFCSEMSQSRQSTDSQALLQSMLQKLNLQTGKDGQTHLQTPVSAAAGSTPGQAGVRRVSDLQNNVVFDFNKIPPTNLKQQPAAGYEVGKKKTFSSQNVSTDGESRVLRLDTMCEFTPKETHHSSDVNLSFFKRTYSERMSFSSSAVTNHVPPYSDTVSNRSSNPNQFQGFTPAWSHPGTAGENGGIGSLKQTTDVQSFSSNQITTNSRKKQRPSENKTRRWTLRIKERWKEKHGKKEKEERGTADQRTEISNSDQVMMAGNVISTPTKCEESTPPSVGSCSPNKMFPAQTEDNTRPSTDFDIGLGSFSLLDEIIKDQEWGKFINPNLTTISTNQRPSEERLSQAQIQPDPFSNNQSTGSLNQLGGGNNQWSFRIPESSPAPVAAPRFQSVHTDVPQRKQQFDQSELMEVGRNQSDMQRSERESGPQPRPSASAESADVLHNAVLKIRGQNSRKRQHQPAENRYGRVLLEKTTSDGQKIARVSAESIFPPFASSSQMMEESVESQQGNVTPPSPSSPPAPALRGVLKQSVSQDSEASVETLTKRRRVEENRRVHFSEQVVTIDSPNMDLDLTDSEEDLEEEEDSLTEQECEVDQAAIEEAAHARRPALPAWIKALKKMNAGKKHR